MGNNEVEPMKPEARMKIDHNAIAAILTAVTLAALLALAAGGSMVYDNQRLFMPAFEFIAALAGIGIDWVLQGLQSWLKRAGREALALPLAMILVLLVFVPHLVLAAPLYPQWPSYYSVTAGGLPGATQIGPETTYWCQTCAETLDYINANAESGDMVWVDPWSYDVMVSYQMLGRLRDDVDIYAPEKSASIVGGDAYLRSSPYQQADFIVLQYRQTSYVEGGAAYIKDWLFKRPVAFSVSYQDIPLIEVFELP
jgi:hypothetical protein